MSLVKILLKSVGNRYVQVLNEQDYAAQKPEPFSERAIEYGFLFRQLNICRPSTILDVGSGDSAFPSILRHCGLVVDAIDYIGADAYWQEHLANRHWLVRDWNIAAQKPLDKTYDAITCVSVIEHIPEHQQAVHNMLRALNSRGNLIITCPYTDSTYYENVYPLLGIEHRYICRSYSCREIANWLLPGYVIVLQE